MIHGLSLLRWHRVHLLDILAVIVKPEIKAKAHHSQPYEHCHLIALLDLADLERHSSPMPLTPILRGPIEVDRTQE
jgi:hypothetical protein